MRRLQRQLSSRQYAHGECGFTLIELMFAIALLGIGMLGAIALMIMGMQSNSRNKTDTTATVLDQEIIELYSTLKSYPKGNIDIKDCALNGTDDHLTDLGPGLGVGGPATGTGAVLYTAATAPTPAQVGDIDWTQPAPTLATGATAGYTMDYKTCNGDTYEVRWNVLDLAPAAGTNSHLSLLTVSTRPKSALTATANGAQNQAILYAVPVTLRSLIEN